MKAIEEVEHLAYLGSAGGTLGETEAGDKARVGKARVAFLQLKNICKSNVLSLKNRIRILNTYAKAVLLCEAETWRTTASTTNRIQTFVNSCLRRILGVWWIETISSEWLWQRICQIRAEREIQQRSWRWIGHILRKPVDSITGQALTLNQGKRKKGRPRNTWPCNLEADVKETGDNWRGWLRTGMPGGTILAAYAPGGATKTLIDSFDKFV